MSLPIPENGTPVFVLACIVADRCLTGSRTVYANFLPSGEKLAGAQSAKEWALRASLIDKDIGSCARATVGIDRPRSIRREMRRQIAFICDPDPPNFISSGLATRG